MESNDLYTFTLLVVLVGMLVGIGVLALDKLGDAAKVTTAANAETVAISSGAGSLANDEVVSFLALYNASNVFTTGSNYNVTLESGALTTAGLGDGDYSANYTYSADSAATTTAGNARTEVANITSNWLGLIVTIAVLAIIITLVVRSFGTRS